MKKNEAFITPINKTKLCEEIVEQLKSKIISREIPPGRKLPPERELARMLEVNRSTLREALGRLASMELIEIRHGDGVYAKDWLESGSLELVRSLLVKGGVPDLAVYRNLLDLRSLVIPEMAYHAALNRSSEHLDELDRVINHSPDMTFKDKDVRVHAIIARACGNVLFILLLNSFAGLADQYYELYFSVEKHRAETAKFHRSIYKALKDKKPEQARKIMKKVLSYAERGMLGILGAGK